MNVRDFGAYGDGRQNDHHAIQAALNENDGLVDVPEGIYKIDGSLRIKSNTRLWVHPKAQLIFGDGAGVDSQSFLLTNRNQAEGDLNIHIEGGIWDGNNRNSPRGPDKPGSYTGALINFINVKDLSIQNLTVRDAETYFIRLGEVRDFLVANIRFESPHLRPNQDGVHLGGYCENGFIRDLVGIGQATNDDLVALNADDALQRAQNLNLKCGPIRNIRVENIKAASCHSFVRLLSVRSPIRDISIENVEGGCRCMAVNLDGCRECRVPLFDPADPKYQDGVGDIQHVKIANLQVHKSDHRDTTPLINIRSNVKDFIIDDFHRDLEKDINPSAPTISFSDFCASQLVLDGISNYQLTQVEKSGDVQSTIEPLGPANIHKSGLLCAVFDLKQKSLLRFYEGGFTKLTIDPVDQVDSAEKRSY
jgi:hypothetical protein